jgi:hypothetical protein
MSSIPQKLAEYIIANDSLPDDGLTLEKINERGYDFKEVEDDVFEFLIERHPGLFGEPSRGKGIGLAAFEEEKTRYRVNLKTDEWSAEVEDRELEFDPWLMANNEIDSLDEGGFFSSLKPDKSNINEVIEDAVSTVTNYYNEFREDGISDEIWNKMISELEKEMREQLDERFK